MDIRQMQHRKDDKQRDRAKWQLQLQDSLLILNRQPKTKINI